MQKSLADFFPPDMSPAGVAMRERIKVAAELETKLRKEEAVRVENAELDEIVSEQKSVDDARRARAEARETRAAARREKRREDLERRSGGIGRLVAPHLFIGNEHCAENDGWLLDARVTAVVNATLDIQNHFERDEGEEDSAVEMPRPSYLRVPVSDSVNDSIAPHLRTAVDFIERSIADGGNVLVHCREGKSRSAAIVAAFLMKNRGMKLALAIDTINTAAWMTSINATFMKELVAEELRLFPDLAGRSSVQQERESRPALVELHPGKSSQEIARLAELQPRPRRLRKKKSVEREGMDEDRAPVAQQDVNEEEAGIAAKRRCTESDRDQPPASPVPPVDSTPSGPVKTTVQTTAVTVPGLGQGQGEPAKPKPKAAAAAGPTTTKPSPKKKKKKLAEPPTRPTLLDAWLGKMKKTT